MTDDIQQLGVNNDFDRFEVLCRLWNDVLDAGGNTVGISSGGVQVCLEYSGDGCWSRDDADEIAVYRDYEEIGRWPLSEVDKA